MPRIITFVDTSVYADSVCDHAAWVAKRMSADVELVHVLGRRQISDVTTNLSGSLSADARDHLLAELSANDEQKSKLAQKRGRLLLGYAKDRIAAVGMKNVTTKLRIEDLVDTMHRFEVDADLIVIGKRGEAADFAKLHLGSNIERVIRASSKPIFIASRAFKPIKRVLIAFDGGASITKGISYLQNTHAAYGDLDVHLLKVGDCTDDAKDRIEHAAGLLNAVGYTAETRILPGQPEQIISEVVEKEKFDLLIMGAFGHSRIRNLFIGSTTVEMIRACSIPIVLFR